MDLYPVMMTAQFRFNVVLDLAESYLYGTATGDSGRFAINLQGGSTGIALPEELLIGLPFAKKAILHFRAVGNEEKMMMMMREVTTMSAEVSRGRDMIEIYDDALLQRLAGSAAHFFEMWMEIR